jgi:hypothetical protein
MKPKTSPDPVDIHYANKRSQYLPDEFFDDLSNVELSLERGAWPEVPINRGRNGRSIPAIRAAILEELRKLLCTSDPRYRKVRGQGKGISQAAVVAIAGYIATTFGIALAFATGAVAFLSLLLLRLGVGVFCAVNPPPDNPQSIEPPRQAPQKPKKRAPKSSKAAR